MAIADTLLWLCSIASPTGEEKALCDAIERWLATNCPKIVLRRYGDSIAVTLCEPRNDTHVVLAGHLDTVGTEHDRPARIEGDKLYGCGASDMKSGLALMLELARSLEPSDCRAGLSLVFYAGEEGAFDENQLEVVLAQDASVRSATFALCLEPSDNVLQLGCAGTLHAEVTFRGTSGHSARPWQGDNAIHKAGPLLCELSALEPQWCEIDGLRYATVTSATVMQGGSARNVIPSSATLNINHRFAPGVTVEQACETVRRFVGQRAEVKIVDASPSALPHRNHPLVEALLQSGACGVTSKQAWTDVGRFERHGIASANFGPGTQAQAHQRNEWTSIPQLDAGMVTLRRWLRRFGET